MLQISNAIVHDVPSRRTNSSSGGPIFSEIDSALTDEIRNYLREKITASLWQAAFEVTLDMGSPSPVPSLVAALLNGTTSDIVRPSKDLATYLYQCQTGVNPAGLLTVITGKIEKKRAVSILKLDRESGVRVLQDQRNGLATFRLESIHDLFLMPKTKVLKVGLFLEPADVKAPIEGWVSDKQRGYEPKAAVADFFLTAFLGGVLVDAPAVATGRLFDAASTFINQEVQAPEDKTKYQIALMAELAGQSPDFDAQQFATQHLDVTHRQAFINALATAGISGNVVRKDRELVARRFGEFRMDFVSGVALIVPLGAAGKQVQVDDLDDGRTHVDIKDQLRAIGAHGHGRTHADIKDQPREIDAKR